MKTEIYECDRCHKKATTKEECDLLALGTIHVGFEKHYSGNGDYNVWSSHAIWSKELCRACRAEIGCLEEKIKEAAKKGTTNIPSLEDMVREIVRQELPRGD